MPRRDGNGPIGQNGMRGRRGYNSNNGTCVCLQCGYSKPHEIAMPCNKIQCPKCGTYMLRQ